jgi:hypothetical protein
LNYVLDKFSRTCILYLTFPVIFLSQLSFTQHIVYKTSKNMKFPSFRKTLLLFSASGLLTIFTLISPVKAETVCKVTDPTGTPLNVRDEPNGQVVTTLKNGRDVYILEIYYDSKNHPWARIGGYYKGEYRVWGWVFREFISCYKRS